MFLALLAAADFALLAGAGSRGERRVEATAHAASEGLGLTLGAAESEGPQAPQRQEVLLGAESGVAKGELRVVPQSAGLFRLGAEAGVHFESISLVLGARGCGRGGGGGGRRPAWGGGGGGGGGGPAGRGGDDVLRMIIGRMSEAFRAFGRWRLLRSFRYAIRSMLRPATAALLLALPAA